MTWNSPNADEVNVDVNRERLLERSTLLPSQFVGARVHLVREPDLLVAARGQQADFVDHASQGPGGVRASREAKDADLVAFFVWQKNKVGQ